MIARRSNTIKKINSVEKKKILLIFPKKNTDNAMDISINVEFLTGKPGGMLILSLATIASLTPKEFELKIIDENIEEINFNESCDIAAIGGFTAQFFRARKIAMEFAKRRVLVVCGGSSVSLSPERWRPFSDVLILGEAERIWPRFLEDYLEGNFKSEYRELDRFDLDNALLPDYSSISRKQLKKYWGGFVQTSRGCPFNCEFCDTPAYAGRKMRYKSIPHILREVEQLYNLGKSQIIGIADDNFSAGRKHAKKILVALRDWNRSKNHPVTFWAQFSIDTAKDDELLSLAAEAGMTNVFIGIETPNTDSLKEANKTQNIRADLLKDIEKINHYGILVSSGCIVGFDNDDLSIFKTQLNFLSKSGIPVVLVWPLQAPDQTPLKKRMVKNNRYVDWEIDGTSDTLNTLTTIPKNMTGNQLLSGTYWLIRELYNPINFANRFETFFRNYQFSPIKNDLNIPRNRTDTQGLIIAMKILRNLMFNCSPDERIAFWRMYQTAQKSSHPQKFEILLSCYLSLKNSQIILSKACPNYEDVEYPNNVEVNSKLYTQISEAI